MLKERAEATAKRIGLSKIDSPVYGNCLVGIRFEIGEGDPFSCYKFRILNKKYFREAVHRAYTIYQNTPGTFDTLLWIIYPYGENTEEKLLDRFCEITSLPPPQERHSEIVPLEDDPDALLEEVRCYWDIQAHPANIELLFKEIVKTDFGGFRELEYWVYFLDTKLNVLLNLYDDRGLDVAAESHDALAPLNEKYGDWIMG